MNKLTLEIDLHATPPDAVAEVLKILNGSNGKAVAAAPANANGSAKTKAAEKTDTKPPATESKLTIETVRAELRKKVGAGHREKVAELLKEYGTESVTDMKPEFYQEFYDKLSAL